MRVLSKLERLDYLIRLPSNDRPLELSKFQAGRPMDRKANGRLGGKTFLGQRPDRQILPTPAAYPGGSIADQSAY